MRYLYAVVIWSFICLLSFSSLQEAQIEAALADNLKAGIDKPFKSLVFKSKLNLSNDIPAVEKISSLPLVIKKLSQAQLFLYKKQDNKKSIYTLFKPLYSSFSVFDYTCIFDFLYPKHVFW